MLPGDGRISNNMIIWILQNTILAFKRLTDSHYLYLIIRNKIGLPPTIRNIGLGPIKRNHHTVACRLPETSTLLAYLVPDRKGLDFWEWLLLFKRLSTFCCVLVPWQSAQPSCVWWCRRWLVCSPQQSTACIVFVLLRLDFLCYLNALYNTPCY